MRKFGYYTITKSHKSLKINGRMSQPRELELIAQLHSFTGTQTHIRDTHILGLLEPTKLNMTPRIQIFILYFSSTERSCSIRHVVVSRTERFNSFYLTEASQHFSLRARVLWLLFRCWSCARSTLCENVSALLSS